MRTLARNGTAGSMALRRRWAIGLAIGLALQLLATACSSAGQREGASQLPGTQPGPQGSGTDISSSQDAVTPTASAPPAKQATSLKPGGTSSSSSQQQPASSSNTGIQRPYRGEIGVDATSIRIGAIYPQSGVFAPFLAQYAKVWQAAFNDLNDREGGIYGRKLVFEGADEGDSTSQALAATRSLSTRVFGLTTFLQESAEANFAEKNRIPAMTLLGNITPGAVNGEYRYSFNLGTPPGYLLPRNAPSFLHARFPKLVDRTGLVTGEIYPGVKEAFERAAKRHRVTLVHVETLAINQAQCFNSVQNVQRARPKVVFVIAGPIEAGCFFRDAKAAGFEPQWTTLLSTIQNRASGGADDGVPGLGNEETIVSPEGKRMVATYKKYYPNEQLADISPNFRAWEAAHMWIQWLKALGPQPTRSAFPAAAENGGPFLDGLDGPQEFSREIHVGSEHTIAGFLGGGKITITDHVWRKTYDGIQDPPFFPFRR